jgi:hypothetical protein
MHSGTALVSPSKDMTITTPFGKVFVAARSLVLVMSLPNGMAVYNLHDRKSGAVVIEQNGRRLPVNPSTGAVFVQEKRASFAEINPAQLFCYGKTNETVSENGKMFMTEFSLGSAINALPMLKHMIASKDPQVARISTDFLKTLAIMQQLSGSRYQDFRQYVKPVMTACR